jgi:hypothetical protein
MEFDFDPSPLGRTAEEAIAWVRAEIERSLPPGWRVSGFNRDPLSGDIERIARTPDQSTQSGMGYGMRISPAFDFLVFTWGNTDAGPLRLEQVLTRAVVIAALVADVWHGSLS